MEASASLLIIEIVLPQGGEPSIGKMIDLEMLVMTGGQERTAKEYRTLLERAGFTLRKIYATRSPFSIIEASPQK